LPGSIHATQSKGCHALIKQGAKLVERASDIMDELPSHTVRKALREADDADDAETTATVSTPSPAATLLKVMGLAPISLDALVTQTQSPAHVLQSLLFELEMAGHVARMPGGQFQQIV
jgi:DNA processing protein